MSAVKIQQNGNEIPVNTVVNQNGGTPIKFWVGSLQQYNDNVDLPDPNTVYLIQQTTS